MMQQKVTHPNIHNLPFLLHLHHRPPSLQPQLRIPLILRPIQRRARPMNQQQIQIVRSEFLQNLIAGLLGLVVALLVGFEFAGDEELFTSDAGGGDGFLDLGLVGVVGGGVDVTVSDF